MSQSRKYELVYILAPETTEETATEVQTLVAQTVERFGGTLDSSDNWGRRKLAYEIGHHKEGVYVLHVVHGSGEMMKEIERRLKVLDHVIRQLAVRVDEEERIIGRVKARRAEAQAQRRVARGLPPVEDDATPSSGDESGDEQAEGAEV